MSIILHINGQPVTLEAVERKANEIVFELNGKPYRFRSQPLHDGEFLLEEEYAPGVWKRTSGTNSAGAKGSRRIQLGALEATVSQAHSDVPASAASGALSPLSPMPSLVRQILVKVGETVSKGQPLAVIEAMKLQITLSAGGDGVVEAVLVTEGALVAEGAELVRLKVVK